MALKVKEISISYDADGTQQIVWNNGWWRDVKQETSLSFFLLVLKRLLESPGVGRVVSEPLKG